MHGNVHWLASKLAKFCQYTLTLHRSPSCFMSSFSTMFGQARVNVGPGASIQEWIQEGLSGLVGTQLGDSTPPYPGHFRRSDDILVIAQRAFLDDLPKASLEACPNTLIGFVGEQVEIRGTVDLQTTFSIGRDTKTILIKFTVVNTWASYNIILG
ncbi:hypothetical protein CR513_42424, partial [Mucuna pruriens]